jgi:hypothetical protein
MNRRYGRSSCLSLLFPLSRTLLLSWGLPLGLAKKREQASQAEA